jgi:hypothetical protein
LFLSAAPKKGTPPTVSPTVVYDTTIKVLRGGTCEVPLRAISPDGYDVEFEIVSQPRSGSLSGPERNSKSSVSYFYTHNGAKNSSPDSFRFKAKSGPQKAWGYAKATILVEEPPARFAVDMDSLDFGAVFLGESRTLPVRIKNAGGGLLQGRLKLSAPWRLGGAVDLTLAEGESQKILITFEPFSTDTQRGSLTFESATKPFPEISLQGVGVGEGVAVGEGEDRGWAGGNWTSASHWIFTGGRPSVSATNETSARPGLSGNFQVALTVTLSPGAMARLAG